MSRAHALEAQVRAELLVAGARPRRARMHGVEALTASELRVAQLAASGKANKEIAATLNLSERTVKFHVSSLLAKFSVRGRMELVREAARHSTPALPVAAPAATREVRTPLVPGVMNYRRGAGSSFVSLQGRTAVQ